MKIFGQKNTLVYCIIITVILSGGCRKFIEVEAPITTVNGENAFSNDPNAIGVLTGIYIKMSDENQSIPFFGSGLAMTSIYCSLSADELALNAISNNATIAGYYKNELTPLTVGNPDFWKKSYGYIYTVNSAILGLTASNTLTPSVKSQLLGEAYFLRAFYYFYLTNLYGGVVVTTETDYAKNSLLSRTDSVQAYNLIKSDLIQAQQLLNDDYYNGNLTAVGTERTRPNKTVATALLARVYLYLKEWTKAEAESSKIINNTKLYDIASLDDAFKKNSVETIWALQPVGLGTQQNTGEGNLFILTTSGLTEDRPCYLSNNLIDEFENGDQRLNSWVRTSTFGGVQVRQAYKYKVGAENIPTAEYPIIFRLAEQYLVRAEARVNQNNIIGAVEDLNIIRKRARGTANNTTVPDLLSSISSEQASSAVHHERRVELFTEWGHRWFDMKRTGTVNQIMPSITQIKGGSWQPTDAYYPITNSEVLNSPNVKQTPGY
jgi:starch-binding outer membrane protein, SusD/RagB family